MSAIPHDRTEALGLDHRAFLAGALLTSAIEQAERALVEVCGFAAEGDRTPEELVARIRAHGIALMDMWTDLMALAGLDREPWAREAALEAVRAYAGRLAELMAASAEGGRS